MDPWIIKLCGIAIVCAVLTFVMKRLKSELSFAPALLMTLFVFGFVISSSEPILSQMSALLELGGAGEYFTVIFKALGVAILTQVSSFICSDLGEGSIAEGIELGGKLEILLICLPMIKKVVGYAMELLSFE